jgi:hypothetical protein
VSSRLRRLPLLVAALAVAGGTYAAVQASSAPNPPKAAKPTITASPPNNDFHTTAGFSFTDSQAGVTLQCSLDGSAYATCTSPRSYPGLHTGGHDFGVRAIATGYSTSDAATYHWTLAGPPKPTVSSGPVNHTFHTDASFTFSDSDTDPGVSFQCRLDNAAWAACTSPKSYPGPIGKGGHDFHVRALNPLGDPGDETVYHWDVDAPPKPVITSGPDKETVSATATFVFNDTDTDPGVTFQCKLDGGTWTACTSPKTYPGPLAKGDHQFSVRLLNAAGDPGDGAEWNWKIKSASGLPVTISGSAIALLYPGANPVPIDLTFSNPNSVQVTVSSVTVSISGTSNASCPAAANFAITQQFTGTLVVPASGSKSLSGAAIPSSQWPQIQMANAGNQNPCKLATVNLTYSATATG